MKLVGANHRFKKVYSDIRYFLGDDYQNKVQEYQTNKKIKWKFISLRSPNLFICFYIDNR